MRLRDALLLMLVLPWSLITSSCVSQRSETPASVDAQPVLMVEAHFPPIGERHPLGWIYAFDDAHGRKNRCVYIWSDQTWSLADETSTGFFGDEIARGCIGVAVDSANAPALDFPSDALDGWKTVYAAGSVSAVYKGQAIRDALKARDGDS